MALAPGKHYVNSPIRLRINFTDDDGNDYDPETVTFKTLDPCMVEATYEYGTDTEVTRIDSGNYAADITPDSGGRWLFRWQTTNGVIALEGEFLVQDSAFYPATWPLSDYT